MTTTTHTSLKMEREIAAPPQEVWDAWTQPEKMRLWSCPAPGGAQKIESDFRVGGSFTIYMSVEGESHTAFGTYKEIDAPKRLVYTWDWREESHAMGATTVTVEFEPTDAGTRVSLLHEGFPAEEAKQGHEEGWGACLAHFEGLFA